MNKIDELQVFYFEWKVERFLTFTVKNILYMNLPMVITVDVKW